MTLRLAALMVSMAALTCAQGPLRFELKRIEKKTAGCVITFEYPEIISAASPQARNRMNAATLRVLLRRSDWPAPDSGFHSLDAYADNFLKFCAAPGQDNAYEHKRVTIFRYTPPILSLRCETYASGGVHPFGTTFFVNFETGTGNTIALTDLVREAALPELESMAEATFRRENGLSPTESLQERSYRFPGGRFRLNENFGIGEKELVFLFNTYEIGPGAMGATQIKLRYQGIANLLKIHLLPW